MEKEISKNPAGVEQGIIVPFIKLEILVYGKEDQKDAMKPMMKDLQEQLDKRPGEARILYYLDKGELTNEEKKEKLISLSKCRYYIFVPETHRVKSTFVVSALDKIDMFEKRMKGMKKAGICIKRNPPEAFKKQIQQEQPIESPVEETNLNIVK